MFEELNRKLAVAKENLRQKKKLENLIKRTQVSLQQMTAEKSELDCTLQKEEHDMQKLESISITGLFYTMLGSKAQQLDKERQEMLAAQLKYDTCCRSIIQLEKELAAYEAAAGRISNADSEYAAAVKQKETAILSSNTSEAQVLSYLMDQSAELNAQKKELAEALSAGETVIGELNKALRSLVSAEGWGTWDMLGGGFIATSIKHSRIDEARVYAQTATSALQRFQIELADINQRVDLDINIGSFNTFTDYFFDGLIADWVVQSKVEQSTAAVRQVAETAGNVMQSLNNQMADLRVREASVNEEFLLTVESA